MEGSLQATTSSTLKRVAKTTERGEQSPKRVKLDNLMEVDKVSEEVSGNSHEKLDKKHGKGKGKDKKDKYKGRRSGAWGPRDATDATNVDAGPKAPRLPKRQCALLIGFCGTGCSGMQIQKGTNLRTIEGILFDALVKTGAVSQDNADDPLKVNLGRAARTDAGVHAAGNVVSMKLIIEVPGVSDLVTRINEELPPSIRLWGYVRVQRSFNARMACDSRKYTYFFPSYMLLPPKPGGGLNNALERHSLSFATHEIDPFWTNTDGSPTEDLARKRLWRISPDRMEALRATAARYIGSHNFHNFTIGRPFADRSNQRVIKSIDIADPVVYGETEWISVLIHGQSFMMHQRKMMAVMVLACRTQTPNNIIDELYGPRTVLIPKMPSLGLLLESPLFNMYNDKIEKNNEKLEPSHADWRDIISFDVHQEKITAFKQEHIYDNMRAIEDRDGIFDAWLRAVDSYAGTDFLYFNPKGVIPTAAVVVKGQPRTQAFKEEKRFDATDFGPGGDEIEDDNDDEIPMTKATLIETEG